jgi:hypothetical protein
LNEGSLLRRTLLHVGTFVVASIAFIGIMSFTLVSIAKGLIAPRSAEAASGEDAPGLAAAAAPGATPRPVAPFRPGVRPGGKRLALPGVTTPTGRPEGKAD